MKYVYAVCILLPDGQNEYTLCRCLTPESAAEVVRALIGADHDKPPVVIVRVQPHG